MRNGGVFRDEGWSRRCLENRKRGRWEGGGGEKGVDREVEKSGQRWSVKQTQSRQESSDQMHWERQCNCSGCTAPWSAYH